MKEKTSLILKIEQELEVSHFKCNGVKIWPLIFNLIIQYDFIESQIDVGRKNVTEITFDENRIKRKVLWFGWRLFSKIISFFSQKKDDLIILKNDEMRKTRSGLSFQHLSAFELKCSGRKLGILKIDSLENKSRIFQALKRVSRSQIKELELQGLSELEDFLALKNLKFDSQLLISTLRETFSYALAYEEFFKYVVKTKNVYFTVFYHLDSFALSIAASNLGIRKIELQHGQQGVGSTYYSFLAKNIGAFSLLPDCIWVWGNQTKLNYPKSESAFVSGNLYLPDMDNLPLGDHLSNDVLYALQPIGDQEFPPFLLETIKKSTNKWYIRLHPKHLGRLDEYKERFKSYANVDFEVANSLDLYSLIGQVKFVITNWSTVVYEAIYFRKIGIIINSRGKEMMGKDIVEGRLLYADCAELLNLALSSNSKIDGRSEHFFCSDSEFINSEIKRSRL